MTLITQRGDKWVAVGTVPAKLKFTALPNSKAFSIPGTRFSIPWTPQKVNTVATCLGPSACVVSHRASGGQYLTMEMQAKMGNYELVGDDGKVMGDLTQLSGANEALPHYGYMGTGLSDMPVQRGVGFGVGVNLDGGNIEDASHIISGPTIGSYKQDGMKLQKAQKPPH
jgi:hypothetical protein